MINIGLIGYGYWGPNLARCIAEAEGCLLAGVADYSAAALARARKRYPGVRLLEDWRELAVDPDIDAVMIATPVADPFRNGAGCAQGRQACARGETYHGDFGRSRYSH